MPASTTHPLNDEKNRFFRAYELPRDGLQATLNMLGLCLSASGDTVDGTGLVGFPSFLLQSGVACTIGALWPVDDEGTARLMIKFHEICSQGKLGTGAALTFASRESGVSADTWAAFTVYGDAEVRWADLRSA